MAIQALLVIPKGGGEERQFARLEPDCSLTIGRSRKNDVVLIDRAVSAQHARVSLSENRLRIEDLGSRNGTWVVSGEGEEWRVEQDRPVWIEAQNSIRIGSTNLVPCEMLGDDVGLCSLPATEATTHHLDSVSTARGGEPRPEKRAEIAAVVARALGGGPPDAAWERVLDGLVELTGADRAFLLAVTEERFLLRASRGAGSLSRWFLERATASRSVWSITIGDERQEAGPSDSLAQYSPGVVLTCVPLPAGSGETIAVACLENGLAPGPPDLGGLELYADSCGPFLETIFELDRVSRRCDALEQRLRRERGAGDEPVDEETGARLVGRSPGFVTAMDTVRRAAPAGSTILIRGPSGCGKEELACLAHETSPRKDRPFLAVNCASLPETLVESELFGADKGAFTGADRARPGAFSRADGGTLFLDEVGDLPLTAQAKILRVIETGEVVRVGGSRQRVDVRLLAATHRNLEEMVEEGTFREDLYYRLRVVEVSLPPLSERLEDLPALAEHFLKQYRRPDGQHVLGVSLRAAGALSAYSWPGNVRELRNVMERAVVLDRDGVIDLDDLPPELLVAAGEAAGAGSTVGLTAVLELPWTEAKNRFEAEYFRQALDRHAGQVQKTAEATGVDRRTLSEKIRRHRLKDEPS